MAVFTFKIGFFLLLIHTILIKAYSFTFVVNLIHNRLKHFSLTKYIHE